MLLNGQLRKRTHSFILVPDPDNTGVGKLADLLFKEAQQALTAVDAFYFFV
ncbi:hypothetical protein F3D3_0800 [Fusibacter sp. 3D3]|nr:hypothetical protein F3D3_0800 [Fusibacter sp. 3D3]